MTSYARWSKIATTWRNRRHLRDARSRRQRQHLFRKSLMESLEARQLLAADWNLADFGGFRQDWQISEPATALPVDSLEDYQAGNWESEDPVAFQLIGDLWDSVQPLTASPEVVFIDPFVPDYASLTAELSSFRVASDDDNAPPMEWVLLDADTDAVWQITDWLSQREGLKAIHLVSHGAPGTLLWGSTRLDSEILPSYGEQLAAWGNALALGGDLLLYGCDVGQGQVGERFLQQLAAFSGADVAASTNPTGTARLGGDWILETWTGPIETTPLFTASTAWEGLLGGTVFGDGWGAGQTRSSSDGTTLDFSAVTGDLVFLIDGATVTVNYADPNRTDSLTYTATEPYTIIGSQGSDRFQIADDSLLTSIDGQMGDDTVAFTATTGLAGDVSITTATRGDHTAFTLSNIETFAGSISLGAGIRGEINQAIEGWATVVTEFVQSELLATRIPLLDISLVEVLGRGFSVNPLDDLDAAKAYATSLLTFDSTALDGLADLGAIAGVLQDQLNSAVSGELFTVSASLQQWSELHLDVSFAASQSFQFAPAISSDVTTALAAAGISLSAFSQLDLTASLGGSVQFGIDLAGITDFDAGSFADRGFLRIDPLTFAVDLDASNITAAAGLSAQVFGSAATVNITDGTARLNARAALSLDPTGADGNGGFAISRLSETHELRLEASGSLDTRLPLSATLGSFDLSHFGTPTLILATDSLLEYQGDRLLVTTPELSLDVALNADLAARLLDLLGQIRDLGQNLPFGLFDQEIPGLGQSLNQLLTNSQSAVDDAGVGGVFKLKDAAGHYFYSDYDPGAGQGTTFTLNPDVTVRGLLETLNRTLASLTQVKFSMDQLDWSGKNLAGFDFAAFRIAGGNDFSLDFLRGLDFSGADLRGADLSGLDLTGIDFSGARFDATTRFDGAILRRADFSGADLRGVNLSGLDLRWAKFSQARIDGVDFRFSAAFDVDWSNVRFSAGNQPNSTDLVSNTDLSGVFGGDGGWKQLAFGLDLSGWTAKNWSRFDLSGLDFSGSNLSGFDLSGANLRGIALHGATLDNANLSGAFAWDVKWGTLASGVNVNISDLLHNLSLPDWGSSTGTAKNWAAGLDLSGFDFSGWDLSGLDFTDITLTGANFAGSLLKGVTFPNFDPGWNFAFADFRGIDLSGIAQLAGVFRGANFSGLDFSGISFAGDSQDFTGADFSFSQNLDGLFSGLSESVSRWFDGVNFGGVDFSGLGADAKGKFKFGGFRGVSFSHADLSGLDFRGVDMSFASFGGSTLTDVNFDGVSLLGARLADSLGDVASAAGAFYDGLTGLPTRWTDSESFMAELNPVVIEDIFATGAPGPAFAFSGGLKFADNQIDLSVHLQANIDRQFAVDFALGSDDLAPSVAAALPTMELAGTAYGRGVLAVDFDLGMLLGVRDASVAGLFTVPLPDPGSLDPYFRLNRFDIGGSLGVTGLRASLEVAGLGSVGVEDVSLGLMAGGRVSLTPPGGDTRLKLSDMAALRTADPANWYKNLVEVTPSAKFDAGFTVTVDSAIKIGDDTFSAVFGNPIVNLATERLFYTDEHGGTRFQSPAVTLDVALTVAQRDTLLSVLGTLKDGGAARCPAIF